MAAFTRLTNLMVTGILKVSSLKVAGIEAVTLTSGNAAGSTPTAEEFAKVVTDLNALKAQLNKLAGED